MKAFVIVSGGFGEDDVVFLYNLMMTSIMISIIIIIIITTATIIILIIILIMIATIIMIFMITSMTNPIQVALVAAVAGEADPYTIGQVLNRSDMINDYIYNQQ